MLKNHFRTNHMSFSKAQHVIFACSPLETSEDKLLQESQKKPEGLKPGRQSYLILAIHGLNPSGGFQEQPPSLALHAESA